MTNLKFQILKKLYLTENKTMCRWDLLNVFHAMDEKLLNPADDALRDLLEDELVMELPDSMIKLSKQGRNLYELTQEEREKASKAERRSRTDRIIAVISIAVTVISVVIAILQFFF